MTYNLKWRKYYNYVLLIVICAEGFENLWAHRVTSLFCWRELLELGVSRIVRNVRWRLEVEGAWMGKKGKKKKGQSHWIANGWLRFVTRWAQNSRTLRYSTSLGWVFVKVLLFYLVKYIEKSNFKPVQETNIRVWTSTIQEPLDTWMHIRIDF